MEPLIATPYNEDEDEAERISSASFVSSRQDSASQLGPVGNDNRKSQASVRFSNSSRVLSHHSYRTHNTRASSITVVTTPKQRWGAVVALLCLSTMCLADVFILAYLYALPTTRGPKISIREDLSLSETE
jgi:hypothetical protein